MAKHFCGLDLGTCRIKLYLAGENRTEILHNAIAIKNKNEVFVCGDEAYRLYERAPSGVVTLFPVKHGVISDFDAMQILLHEILHGGKTPVFRSTRYLLAVPTDVTEVEKRAVYHLLLHAETKAKQVLLVERSLADAIGIGIDVLSPDPHFVVNLGGGTTEYTILASGGIILNRMARSGGLDLDQAIASYIRREYHFRTGIFACEAMKNTLGSAYGVEEEIMNVPGQSLVSGLPGEIQINAHEVYTAIKPAIDQVIATCAAILERIPPEIGSRVRESGIYLTGGVSQLRNLSLLMERTLQVPVHCSDDPENSTVRGLKAIINTNEYRPLAYSIQDSLARRIR